jgi:hypothetical protein
MKDIHIFYYNEELHPIRGITHSRKFELSIHRYTKNRNSLVFVVRFSKKCTANIIIAVRRSTKRTAKIVGPFLFFHFRVWYLFLRAAENTNREFGLCRAPCFKTHGNYI